MTSHDTRQSSWPVWATYNLVQLCNLAISCQKDVGPSSRFRWFRWPIPAHPILCTRISLRHTLFLRQELGVPACEALPAGFSAASFGSVLFASSACLGGPPLAQCSWISGHSLKAEGEKSFEVNLAF